MVSVEMVEKVFNFLKGISKPLSVYKVSSVNKWPWGSVNNALKYLEKKGAVEKIETYKGAYYKLNEGKNAKNFL